MKIRYLSLVNYRCFKEFEICFDDKLTVFVGENGTGKTAVLDALCVYLKYAAYFMTGSRNPIKVPLSDITIGSNQEDFWYRVDAVSPSSIELYAGATPVSTHLNWERFTHDHVIFKADKQDFLNLEILTKDKPVLVAYMAGRFVHENDFIMSQNNKETR